MTDDIDGSEATTTIRFAIEGAQYELDLNDENTEKFREALAPFVGAARKGGRSNKRGSAHRHHPSQSMERRDSHAVREWAHKQGYDVNRRGRLPAHVIEAYTAAHTHGTSAHAS